MTMKNSNRLRSFLLGAIGAGLVLAILYGGMHLFRDTEPASEARQPTRPADLGPITPIDCAWYRKTSEFDPGTIRVYIRNTSDREWSFRQVLLDGLPIPVWGVDEGLDDAKADLPPDAGQEGGGEHQAYADAAKRFSGKRVIWARLAPAVIAPGEIGEFMAKIANPMPRPMKVEFVPVTGETLATVVRPTDPPLTISMVTFGEDLRTVYVYLKGNREEPITLRGLELNGRWLSPANESSNIPENGKPETSESLWLSSNNLETGEKQLAVVTLPEPLMQGGFIVLKAYGNGGETVEERVRVFSGFPVNAEGYRAPPPGFGLDTKLYDYRPAYMTADTPEGPSSPSEPQLHSNYVFACAMHTFAADHRRSAQEILRRYELCLRFDPHHPSFQHLCRIRPETGFALFGEIADIIRTNPNITTGLSETPPNETPFEAVARIARYACVSAAPRRVQTVAHSTPFGETRGLTSPDEMRRRVHALLGTGVKGVIYRHHAWNGKEPAEEAMNNEIRRLNAELAHLRDYLAIADTVDWVAVKERDDVNAYSLLAGPDALVVILVRHASGKKADEMDSAGEQVNLALRLPEWFVPGDTVAVSPEGMERLDATVTADDGLALPTPAAAATFLIRRANQ